MNFLIERAAASRTARRPRRHSVTALRTKYERQFTIPTLGSALASKLSYNSLCNQRATVGFCCCYLSRRRRSGLNFAIESRFRYPEPQLSYRRERLERARPGATRARSCDNALRFGLELRVCTPWCRCDSESEFQGGNRAYRPINGWRFCLIDSYNLDQQGFTEIVGSYKSAACSDYARVDFRREP